MPTSPELDRFHAIRNALQAFEFGDFSLEQVDQRELTLRRWVDPPHLPAEFWARRWSFAVRHDRSLLGEFSGRILDDRNRGDYLEIGKLILRSEAQKKGLARALQAHLDQVLPPLGIDKVRVSASGAGGFAWARLGYDFDMGRYLAEPRFHPLSLDQARAKARAEILDSGDPHEWELDDAFGGGTGSIPATDSVLRLLHRLKSSDREAAAFVQEFVNLMQNGEPRLLATPAAIAEFGQSIRVAGIPKGSWLGREVMIRARWMGIRQLAVS
jgi:GNAT superfamily N-acetyltransferase